MIIIVVLVPVVATHAPQVSHIHAPSSRPDPVADPSPQATTVQVTIVSTYARRGPTTRAQAATRQRPAPAVRRGNTALQASQPAPAVRRGPTTRTQAANR